MACYCAGARPFVAEGVAMDCRVCPYSDGEADGGD